MRTLKKTLCLVLCLAMMAGLCAFGASAAFTDEEEINYKEAVAVLSGIGVINGFEDGSFRPAGTLTRAQACKIITYVLKEQDVKGTCSFTDCQDESLAWAKSAIAYCAAKEIVAGYGDGTFGPQDTLTGYAFAKMLLVALGYNAVNEGMVGADWEIGVGTLVKKTELAAGIKDFDGTADLSREAACQMAYTALYTAMVEYESNGVTIKTGDVEITTGASAAKKLDATLQNTLYKTLKTKDVENKYGEAAKNIVYGEKEDVLFTKTSATIVTFTAKTAEAAVEKALGKVTYTAKTAADIAKLTGNGVEVRVEITNKVVTNVFVVETTFAPVAVSEVKATKTTGAYTLYEVADKTLQVFSTVVNAAKDVDTATVIGTVKDKDVVAVYLLADGTYAVAELDTAAGKVNSRSAADVFTVGADKYELAAAAMTGTKDALNNALAVKAAEKVDTTVYVDRFGYVAGIKAAVIPTAADVYGLVAAADQNWTFNTKTGKSEATYTADVVYADGTVETLVVNEDAKEKIGNVYVIPAADKLTGETKLGAKQTAKEATLAKTLYSGMYANAATVFVSADYTKNAKGDLVFDGTATVVTGVANVAAVKAANIVAFDNSKPADGIADIVFILTTTALDAKVEDTFVYVVPGYTAFDGINYTYDAIIKGEDTTIDSSIQLDGGLYASIVTTNGKTVATKVGKADAASIQNKGGFVALNGDIDAALAAADDVPVYVFDAEGALTVKTFAGLTTAAEGAVYLVKETKGGVTTISAVYVLPADPVVTYNVSIAAAVTGDSDITIAHDYKGDLTAVPAGTVITLTFTSAHGQSDYNVTVNGADANPDTVRVNHGTSNATCTVTVNSALTLTFTEARIGGRF